MLNSHLPEDLVIEIFFRVPVKSLIGFKCVSKSWRSLIFSPRFTSLYHKQASISPIKKILVSVGSDNVASIDCDRSHFRHRYDGFYRYLRSPFPAFLDSFHVVGSSNGLICVFSGKPKYNLHVWNPSTEESIEIVPDIKHNIGDYPFVTRLGFGYDEFGDDYKIVMATSRCGDGNDVDPMINIYSSKTGTWRCLADNEGLHLCPKNQLSATLVNGALHWQLEEVALGLQEAKIVTFDLAEERFRGFLPPPGVRDVYATGIGIVNELLCCSYEERLTQSVWVMKEYGVESSWTKLFTVGDPTRLFFDSLPLCSRECGEIIFANPSGLVLLNLEKDTRIPFHSQYFGRATVYVETLISPHVLRPKEKKYD